MKTLFLYLFIVFTLYVSCSSAKKTVVSKSSSTTEASSENDGSSFDKAIVIHQDHETQGISDEYAWIRNKYPGSKTQSQSLSYNDKKPYDIIHIVTADGKEMAIYFDISNFFGK